jgi:hypothetical protein
MMEATMKWAAFLLCSFSCWAGLADVKSVYLLPMRNGLDQYLANRLTNAGFFRVVTDPQKADAVFTDRLGDAFEDRFNELFAPPEPPKPPKDKAKDKNAKSEDQDAVTAGGPAHLTTFSRAKGNVFLVDVKSSVVLWSTFEQPKDSMATHVDGAAFRIVKSLQKVLVPKGK